MFEEENHLVTSGHCKSNPSCYIVSLMTEKQVIKMSIIKMDLKPEQTTNIKRFRSGRHTDSCNSSYKHV